MEEMDEVFGSVGLAAADQERQAAIEKRLGLDAYGFVGEDSASEKQEISTSEKQDISMKA